MKNYLKNYKVKKGKHDFKPFDSGIIPIINFKEKVFTWEVEFTENSAYLLDNNDQADINKGGGITSYFSPNNSNSIMWGFSWNPKINKMDIYLYINKKDKTFKFYKLSEFELNKKYKLYLLFTKKNNSNELESVSLNTDTLDYITINDSEVLKDFKSVKIVRKIGLYFGGNRTAPKDISLKLRYYKK